MKKIQAILVFLLLLNYLPAQKSNSIQHLIEGLPTTDSLQKDINLLWSHFDIDQNQLKAFKKTLNQNMNEVLAKKSSPFNVYHLALELCNADLLKIDKEADKHIIASQARIRDILKQDANYQQWMWEDTIYSDLRYQSGVLLDLMSHLKSKASTKELRTSYRHFQDTRLKFFALKSMLEKGESVDPSSFLPIAAEDETRELLFELLESHELLAQFPKEYKTQEALSRSNMVNWLVYPTELGRTPDKIELLEVVTINYSDVGETEYYLWKFISSSENWEKDAWMVGMSGPYVKSESPTTRSYGYTFSAFTKLEDKSPQEHFEEIMDILNKANEDKE